MKNMKKCICILLCLGLCLGLLAMASCGKTGGPGVTEEVTMPDTTDEREPSADIIDGYKEKISTVFGSIDPVPATDLTYTVDEDGETVTITGYTGGEVIVVLPDTIEDMSVVAIAEKAFSGSAVEALYIPDSVEGIGLGALEKCNSLRTLRTPVLTVGDVHPYFGALFGASSYEINNSAVSRNLTMLLVGGDVTEIPDYALYDCTNLQCVSLPESVESIGKFAFWGCTSLEWLDLSQTSLTIIGTRALTNCGALLRFDLPATVAVIGEGVVEGCGSLEGMTLPFVGGTADGMPADAQAETTAIDTDDKETPVRCDYLGYVFGAKSYTFTEGFIPASLMEITLQEGCTAIPDNAFYGVSSVREWHLPSTIQTIGRRAFYGCDWLTTLVLPDILTSIGDNAFHSCVRLETVMGGKALVDMGVQVFMDCYSLKKVTLPDSMTYIPNACFMGCISLETVTAKGVTSSDKVGKQAYRHCDNLTAAPFAEYGESSKETF